MSLTGAQLLRIAPRCPNPDDVAERLWDAMLPNGICLVTRAAAFIGQLCHECDEFVTMDEVGNTDRYHGRGYIQLTGPRNYAAAGLALGLELTNHPELAALPANAANIAVWFWMNNNLNPPADAGDFKRVTLTINGGYNGLDARLAYTHTALAVLGAGVPLA
jgi:putative chitinase